MLKLGFSGVNNPRKDFISVAPGLVNPGFERQLAHCALPRTPLLPVLCRYCHGLLCSLYYTATATDSSAPCIIPPLPRTPLLPVLYRHCHGLLCSLYYTATATDSSAPCIRPPLPRTPLLPVGRHCHGLLCSLY